MANDGYQNGCAIVGNDGSTESSLTLRSYQTEGVSFLSSRDSALLADEIGLGKTVQEPGHETCEACPPTPTTYCDPEAWKHGGGSAWLTGSYDPELNLTYWGIGNPGPDFNRAQRPGDNLYTSSVVALDADTGEIRWHFQFTPDDPYDYDLVQIPVLADITRNNTEFKVMLWANRNGFYYVLDRATGRFLSGRPFVTVNWAEGLDDSGRPIETPQPPGAPTYPGIAGGTNWYSPSYSPRTELFYIPAWEDHATVFGGEPVEYEEGQYFTGGRIGEFGPVPDAPALPRQTRSLRVPRSSQREGVRKFGIATATLVCRQSWSCTTRDSLSPTR